MNRTAFLYYKNYPYPLRARLSTDGMSLELVWVREHIDLDNDMNYLQEMTYTRDHGRLKEG